MTGGAGHDVGELPTPPTAARENMGKEEVHYSHTLLLANDRYGDLIAVYISPTIGTALRRHRGALSI